MCTIGASESPQQKVGLAAGGALNPVQAGAKATDPISIALGNATMGANGQYSTPDSSDRGPQDAAMLDRMRTLALYGYRQTFSGPRGPGGPTNAEATAQLNWNAPPGSPGAAPAPPGGPDTTGGNDVGAPGVPNDPTTDTPLDNGTTGKGGSTGKSWWDTGGDPEIPDPTDSPRGKRLNTPARAPGGLPWWQP